jgi:hypothetical protein
MIQALQLGIFPMRLAQTPTMPMQVSTAQTGFDINSIINMMIPMMMMVMMMRMMMGAVGGSSKTKALKAG